MSDVPVQVVVAAFDDEKSASNALADLKDAKRMRLIGITDAAVIRKDDNGKLHIKETADMGGGKGAAIGGVAGAAIGAIASAATLAVPIAVGGLIGGLSAKLRDSGFPDDRLETIGRGLQPGSSAIVAVVEHKWVETVRAILEEEAADMIAEGLGAEIATQLEHHHTTAYTALRGEGGLAAGTVALGDEEAEGGVFVAGGERMAGGAFTATDEGIAVAAVGAGPGGAVAGMAAEGAEGPEGVDEANA